MKMKFIIVIIFWDFGVHSERCYFWCLAGMYPLHIQSDWLSPGGCTGMGWKKMC